MRCRTHVVSSNALMLMVLSPKDPVSLTASVVAAGLGGVISDLDVRTSDMHKAIDVTTIVFTTVIVLTYLFDLKYNLKIFDTLHSGNYLLPIIGILAMLLVSFYGSHQPHRSFMHSFLALFIFGFITFFCFGDICIPFSIGMISHILLDLLNKKTVRIFYPAKKGFSLKLCEYGGLVDNTIFYSSIFFIILKLFLL